MKYVNWFSFIMLIALTLITVLAGQKSVVLASMSLKFLIIAYGFMEIWEAHIFYKLAGALYIGAAALVFAALL